MENNDKLAVVIPPMSTAMRIMVLHDIISHSIGDRVLLDTIDLNISECLDICLKAMMETNIEMAGAIMAKWNLR